MQKASDSPKLLLIDGMSIVFQSFYAIRGLSNAQGLPTGAIYGFIRQTLKLIEKVNPTHIVIVFDSPGPTFRHEIYPEYKANRQEAPDDLRSQIPHIFKVIEAFALPSCAKPVPYATASRPPSSSRTGPRDS